jgi:rSAM/selenodomain-associated transferase 2
MAAPQARAAVVAEPLTDAKPETLPDPLPDSTLLSIIIPVLNEAECLDKSLTRLFEDPWIAGNGEVIICDGGSRDDSLAIAHRYPCRIVHSAAGRALQMNQGAKIAQGHQLLFLHADSVLPTNLDEQFPAAASWGYFHLRLDNKAVVYRIIESAINLRSRMTHVAGGDQGLFFTRDFFYQLGTFPVIPLMEDVAICKLARRQAKPLMITSPIQSSSRRWQDNGVLKTILLMWSLRLAYWLGVDPDRLHRIYYPQQG